MDLKRKIKEDEIKKVKKQKMDLEATIRALKDGIIKETLLSDNNHDLSSTGKVAAFYRKGGNKRRKPWLC